MSNGKCYVTRGVEPCMRKYYIRFLARLHAPVRRLRVFFSRFLLRGTQERTLRRTLGPRPGSVARALGVQSRASWLVFKGLCSAPSSRAGSWKPKRSDLFARSAAVSTVPHRPQELYFEAATIQQQPRFKLFPL